MKNFTLCLISLLFLCIQCKTGNQTMPAISFFNQTPPGNTPKLFAPDYINLNSHAESWKYRCQKTDAGYLQPELLPPSINTEHLDYTPYIAPVEGLLLFASISNTGWKKSGLFKRRSLTCLFPEHGAFTVLIVLGGKEMEKHADILSDISPPTTEQLDNTHHYHADK